MTARELAAHILRTAPGGTYGTIPIDRLTAAIEARDAEAANECQCPNCDGEAHVAIASARAEVERLERKTKEQARQLTYLKEANHARNVEMDALHFVWCDGGCKGGVHRWTETTVTVEVVEAAERNAKRLRSWFINATARAARALASAPPATPRPEPRPLHEGPQASPCESCGKRLRLIDGLCAQCRPARTPAETEP